MPNSLGSARKAVPFEVSVVCLLKGRQLIRNTGSLASPQTYGIRICIRTGSLSDSSWKSPREGERELDLRNPGNWVSVLSIYLLAGQTQASYLTALSFSFPDL